MARRFRFQNEKRERQRDQEQSRQIHRQKMHVVERQDQTDSADHAWRDDSRMRELRVQAEHAENQQHKENIRLDNARQKFLPRREFKGRAHRVFQRQGHFGAVKSCDGPAVQLVYQVLGRIRDQVDHLAVQRFRFCEGFALGDGFLR